MKRFVRRISVLRTSGNTPKGRSRTMRNVILPPQRNPRKPSFERAAASVNLGSDLPIAAAGLKGSFRFDAA